MNSTERRESSRFQVPDGFQILNGDTLVVLRAASIDMTIIGAVSRERRMHPFLGFGGNGIDVRVEENRGKFRVGAEPCDQKDGFAGDELDGPRSKTN